MNDVNQSKMPTNNGAHITREEIPDVGTILLAETNGDVRSVIKEFLEKRGHRVLDASTETEALAISHGYKGEIHLAIAENSLSGMDGCTLVKRLRQHRPRIRILLMSSVSVPDFEAIHMEKLKIPVIWKPFSFSDLEGTVDELLREHTQG